jgi:xylulokinase
VLGAQDQKCSAIGAGITDGIAAVSLGTATAISTLCNKPVLDEKLRIPCFSFDRTEWILESVISTSGVSLKWLKSNLFKELSYGELDRMAEKSNPGANGIFFYPHMEGASSPYWKSEEKGFLYGLSLSTNENDIIRAFLEGIAFQIKINLDIHEELNQSISEVRIYGGGANSDLWCSIIADITGKTVSLLYTPEIANLGAAILAGTGTGIYTNYFDALSKIGLIKKKYNPLKENVDTYNRIYSRYVQIQNKIIG